MACAQVGLKGKGMAMKNAWICALGMVLLFGSQAVGSDRPSREEIERKVDDLLRQMTLEEKVGQMTQVTLQVVAADSSDDVLDPQKLRRAILDYHVGSILNVVNAAYTVDQWHRIITQIQDVATKESRLGIPILYGIDAVHGANYTVGATIFPHNLGMAATWNPELVRKNGEITAFEVRACGIPWNFSPVLDIGRQPLWPRLFETFGEDPYLAATMGAAYVKGLEGEDNYVAAPGRVAGCAKHYLGYSFPLTGKDRTPAWIPENMLREYFVPTFRAAIQAGVHTVMANSGEVNGRPVHANKFILTDLLRGELGFNGLLVSDWADINNLHYRDHVASTQKEAVKMAVLAGVDMSMVPEDFSFYELLLELAREGEVPEARIDEAVRRILRLKFELGLFENPYPDAARRGEIGHREFRRVALQAAQESITLLKNAGDFLPLKKTARVLVTGPAANCLSCLNGGWTITWQGNREDLYPQEKLTILEAIQQKVGERRVRYVPGATFDREIDVKAAVKAAAGVDVVIACVGEAPYCETPGNILDLNLPEAQLRLVEALERTGVPVVVVLVEGRPRVIRRIVDGARAILMAYLPGLEGGQAIADILFGDVNPSGKLPITYPRHPNDLTLYDHKYSEENGPYNRYNPEWPFGHGLSYTRFEFADLEVFPSRMSLNDTLTVRVKVRNVGAREGAEVVQLYVSDLYASVTPSVRKLKRFEKVSLAPGQEKTVLFRLTKDDLAFIGLDNRPNVEPGDFRVSVGPLSAQFELGVGR
ncbi:MAG: glycoside hydrolase family 3 C-terminal domain-containing protein [candidate division KSB1 bacterium]|nr:glycoside hydrolase family 3 C-terminal domain-containing protein [candidate division KSB1 bacterium]